MCLPFVPSSKQAGYSQTTGLGNGASRNSGSPLHVPADSGHFAIKGTIVRSVPWFTFICATVCGRKRQQVNNCPGDESSQHSIRLTKALLQQSRDGAGTSRQGSRLEIGQGFRSFHPAPANLKRHLLPHKSVLNLDITATSIPNLHNTTSNAPDLLQSYCD